MFAMYTLAKLTACVVSDLLQLLYNGTLGQADRHEQQCNSISNATALESIRNAQVQQDQHAVLFKPSQKAYAAYAV